VSSGPSLFRDHSLPTALKGASCVGWREIVRANGAHTWRFIPLLEESGVRTFTESPGYFSCHATSIHHSILVQTFERRADHPSSSSPFQNWNEVVSKSIRHPNSMKRKSRVIERCYQLHCTKIAQGLDTLYTWAENFQTSNMSSQFLSLTTKTCWVGKHKESDGRMKRRTALLLLQSSQNGQQSSILPYRGELKF